MRRLSRVLMGGAIGLLAGLGAAHFSGLRGAETPLVLAPLGALLVLLFQIRRDDGFGVAFAGFYTALIGAAVSCSVAYNWLEPLALIHESTLVTYRYVFAAWGGLLAAPVVLLLPVGLRGLVSVLLMLLSGNVLLAILAVMFLIYVGVRTWARAGY